MIDARDLQAAWGVQGIDLRVDAGERVLITGPSGSGKSTLLRLLAGLLSRTAGTLEVGGSDPEGWSPRDRARVVGFVQQQPADQHVLGTVAEEVAFGAEQVGRPVPSGLLEQVGLRVPPHTSPHALSGGQSQRLAVAASRSAGADLLLLDEPLAHLDPEGVRDLLGCLTGTVVLVEHRLEATLDWADRVIVVREGQIVFDGVSPAESDLEGLEIPPMMRASLQGPVAPRVPARQIHHSLILPAVMRGTTVLEASRSWSFAPGDRIALMGPNGCGKSTTLEALADALNAVWIPQDAELTLFRPTVSEELAYGPEEHGRPATLTLQDLGLEGLGERAPHRLSKGQQLRVAVGAGAATGHPFLLLDEPTAGQHRAAVDAVFSHLGEAAVVFATHDRELVLRWATHLVIVGGPEGPPHEVLHHLPLPPLQRAQAERGWPLVDAERQRSGPVGEVGEVQPAAMPTAVVEVPRPSPAPPSTTHLIALGVVGLLAVLLDRPFSLAGLAVVGMGFLLTRPVALRLRLRLVGALALVAWTTVFSQGLFYGDEPRVALVELGPVVVWREGLFWGAVQSLRLVAVAAVGLGIAVSTSTAGLAGLLVGVRVPGALALLVALAVQAVPSVGRSWWTARTARARRGRPLWKRSPWAWLRTEIDLLAPVLRRALVKGQRLADSLDARGFDVTQPRVKAVPWNRGVGVAAATLVGVVLSLQLLEALYTWDVFYDPALRPVYAWVRQWL